MTRTLAIAALLAGVALVFGPAPAARAGTLPNISGTWDAQGDRGKRCTISQSGTSITLTNERGQTAHGSFVNPSVITTSWSVEGRISGSLDTILWNNSTTWTRHPAGAHTLPDLSGTWYSGGGDPSKRCQIRQHGNSLTFTNESGQTASGSFENPRTIAANWSGRHIKGHLSADFWRIDWSNHTRWTRGSY